MCIVIIVTPAALLVFQTDIYSFNSIQKSVATLIFQQPSYGITHPILSLA